MQKSSYAENESSIAITPGEPAGIGPDIVIQLAHRGELKNCVVIADETLMKARANQLNLSADFPIVHVPLRQPSQAGSPECANASYVLETLRVATAGCLKKKFSAVVTGPIHKKTINDAGISFSGHTEFFAQETKTTNVVMMLVTPGLRVALVTTHLPLAKVSQAITPELLENTLRITHQDLMRYFGVSDPRMMVCGLNPHAGEGGYLGDEEIKIIIPVINKLKSQGLCLEGPLPADTIFTEPYLQRADVIVAMYHDQGLPVLKHKGFGQAVNITLGLPFIRTSVDHGTAFDLAGSGRTDPGSLLAAIAMAKELSHQVDYAHSA